MSQEEKEEARLKAKKAKEDLEQFLLNNKRMTSTIKYYACHDLFHHYDSWQNVPEGMFVLVHFFNTKTFLFFYSWQNLPEGIGILD